VAQIVVQWCDATSASEPHAAVCLLELARPPAIPSPSATGRRVCSSSFHSTASSSTLSTTTSIAAAATAAAAPAAVAAVTSTAAASSSCTAAVDKLRKPSQRHLAA